jgi:hypothetical protein
VRLCRAHEPSDAHDLSRWTYAESSRNSICGQDLNVFVLDHLETLAARNDVVEEQVQCGWRDRPRTVGHERAPSPLNLEQTIRSQDLQRLTHGYATDTEFNRKLFLGSGRGAGSKRSSEDARLKHVGELKVQR